MLPNPTRRLVISGQQPTTPTITEATTSSRVRAIICDIEGTTTSISFVKDVLFPYALAHVRAHLADTWTEPGTQTAVRLLRTEAAADALAAVPGAIAVPDACETDAERSAQIDALVRVVEWQMAADRKATPLKMLQGQIWAKAYQCGLIQGHVFDDVPAAMDGWLAAGCRVGIYSSGSVAAQKLLFGHSVHGDMTGRLNGGLFDTQIGSKLEAQSYAEICQQLGDNCDANAVVFLTDSVAEANAAREAGMTAILVDRPGNLPISEADRGRFAVVKSFADITLVVEGEKRKRSEEPEDDAADTGNDDGTVAKSEIQPSKVAKIETPAAEVEIPEAEAAISDTLNEENGVTLQPTPTAPDADVDDVTVDDVANVEKVAVVIEAVTAAVVNEATASSLEAETDVAASDEQQQQAVNESADDLAEPQIAPFVDEKCKEVIIDCHQAVVGANADAAASVIETTETVETTADPDECKDVIEAMDVDVVDVEMAAVVRKSAAADLAQLPDDNADDEAVTAVTNVDGAVAICSSNGNGIGSSASDADEATIENAMVDAEQLQQQSTEKTDVEQPAAAVTDDNVAAVGAAAADDAAADDAAADEAAADEAAADEAAADEAAADEAAVDDAADKLSPSTTADDVADDVLSPVADDGADVARNAAPDTEATVVNGDTETTTVPIAAGDVAASADDRNAAKVQCTCGQLYAVMCNYVEQTSAKLSADAITMAMRAALENISDRVENAALKPNAEQAIATVELSGYYVKDIDGKFGSPEPISAAEDANNKRKELTFITDIKSVYEALQLGVNNEKTAMTVHQPAATRLKIQGSDIIVEIANDSVNAEIEEAKLLIESAPVIAAENVAVADEILTMNTDSVIVAVGKTTKTTDEDCDRKPDIDVGDMASIPQSNNDATDDRKASILQSQPQNGLQMEVEDDQTNEKCDEPMENKAESSVIGIEPTPSPIPSNDVQSNQTVSCIDNNKSNNATEHCQNENDDNTEQKQTEITAPRTDDSSTTPLIASTSPTISKQPITLDVAEALLDVTAPEITTKTDQPDEGDAAQPAKVHSDADSAPKPATNPMPNAYQPIDASEKVSRVEITIESIDKQPGHVTQTTTTIVKEMCIKEQLVSACSTGVAINSATKSSDENATNGNNEAQAGLKKRHHVVVNVEPDVEEKKLKLETSVVVKATHNGDVVADNGNDNTDAKSAIGTEAKMDAVEIERAVVVTSSLPESAAPSPVSSNSVEQKDAVKANESDNVNLNDDSSDKENDTSSVSTVNGADPASVVAAGTDNGDADEKMDVSGNDNDEAKSSMNSGIIEQQQQQQQPAVAEAMTA